MNLDSVNVNAIAAEIKLGVDDTRQLIDALREVWALSEKASSFPCIPKCVSCCSNAAITCSRLEYEIIKSCRPKDSGNNGFGCAFKSKSGCSVYNLRPLVCRMYGHYVDFEAPSVIFRENLMGKTLGLSVGTPGFCVKKRVHTPLSYSDLEQIMIKYKVIVDATKIVAIGLFKDKDLNNGLKNIDRLWQEKNKTAFWIRE